MLTRNLCVRHLLLFCIWSLLMGCVTVAYAQGTRIGWTIQYTEPQYNWCEGLAECVENVSVPPDASEWVMVASGTFENIVTKQEIIFPEQQGHYVWFRAISEVRGEQHIFASIAELGVQQVLSNIGVVEIEKDNWSLIYVDSEELGSRNDARYAFDDNTQTFWHTEWQQTQPDYSHDIVVNLGQTYTIAGFSIVPRQDGGLNGRIGQYELYVKGEQGTRITDLAETKITADIVGQAQPAIVVYVPALPQGGAFVSQDICLVVDPTQAYTEYVFSVIAINRIGKESEPEIVQQFVSVTDRSCTGAPENVKIIQ